MTSRIIRRLDAAEIARLVDWAAAEGWNPGLNDAAAFQAADPDGFIGAFVDGEMVAGISAVAYGASYGFIGLYISRQDMRGAGHGKVVWNAGMARLGGRTIGLDGVDAQFENYRSKGFAPAYRTIRFGGLLKPRQADDRIIVSDGGEHLPAIIAFDRKSFPERRDAFLAGWLAPPHCMRVAISDGAVSGYGVMRRCRTGWKIGGLSAVDSGVAAALVRSLGSLANDDVYIDVPATQQQFIDFLMEAGLRPGFETTRMYKGNMIPLAPELFGVTTLELG